MKTFPCPKCGAEVEARADYIARGLKCPACNTGFSPVEIKAQGFAPKLAPVKAAPIVLGLGVAILISSWLATAVVGMIGGGFVAVVGAVLMLRK